jgi:alpha-1,3-rhamnosyl/mannosyltransferase
MPEPTGVARYYRAVAGALARHDPSSVRVVAASPTEADAASVLPPDVTYRQLGGPRRLRALAWAGLHRPVLRGWDPPVDVVHVLSPWTVVPSAAPLVATLHDFWPMVRPAWYPRLHRWMFSRAITHLREHAAAFVAISAHTARQAVDVAGIDPARVRVVHHGVPEGFRAPIDATVRDAVCARYGVEHGRYIVQLGGVSTRKNTAVLLEALARTADGALGRPALLVVGPDRWEADKVREHAARLGLHDRVRFAGFVPDDDVPALVSAALLLAHPSRDEGFGLTPIEAMAAGVPVIASTAGSVPEVVGDAAVLCDPDDPAAWAAAIEGVASDRELRADLVARGAARQAEFSWSRGAEQLVEIYRAVLSGRPLPEH